MATVGELESRFIFLMRSWHVSVLDLQGSTEKATRDNVNMWLDDFENLFRQQQVNINVASGSTAISTLNNLAGTDLFFDVYKSTVAQLSQKDLTQARLLRNQLALDWRDLESVNDIYEEFDQFVKESRGLGLTLREKTKFLETNIVAHDVTYLTDRAGRKWMPDRYADMYAKTRSAEVADELNIDGMVDADLDVVQVSNHNTTTPICKQYEGKYFSLTGKTDGIPVLPIRAPFHPNCQHFLIPKRKSPSVMIRTNSRKDKQISQYNTTLTKGQKSSIRKQHEWQKENRQLPSEKVAAAG